MKGSYCAESLTFHNILVPLFTCIILVSKDMKRVINIRYNTAATQDVDENETIAKSPHERQSERRNSSYSSSSLSALEKYKLIIIFYNNMHMYNVHVFIVQFSNIFV